MKSKAELRAEIRDRQKRHGPERMAAESTTLCERLRSHPRIQSAATLGIFIPLSDEPDLLPLYRVLACRMAVPVFEGERWHFRKVKNLTLGPPGAYGIRLPELGPAVSASELDTVLVPGRTFTPDGRRLGRGAGIYDRLLANSPAWRLGIAFGFQMLSSLPAESHDLDMHEIIWSPSAP